MQGGDGVFVEKGAEAGIGTLDRSRGAGLADLNADGLLDIVVVNRRAPIEIWQNTSQSTGHWVAVALLGTAGNSQAVGAWVVLRSDDRLQSREVTVGGGHVSGQALPLHFGLGPSGSAEIRVIWPDGTASPWRPVTADTTVTISQTEPAGSAVDR
jgi:hypothetical protein